LASPESDFWASRRADGYIGWAAYAMHLRSIVREGGASARVSLPALESSRPSGGNRAMKPENAAAVT